MESNFYLIGFQSIKLGFEFLGEKYGVELYT
jgi:hypothetical protein